MPLQNRVDPWGTLCAHPGRGLLMGNRGGRIHTDERKLGSRRWTSRQWICCVLDFNGRHHSVWSNSYTELFFLDEVTALAAGHRPCFECRRADALRFANCWRSAATMDQRPSAGEMDKLLHAERLDGKAKRRHRAAIEALPDGVLIVQGEEAFALRGGALLRWTPGGYDLRKERPTSGMVEMLTPPAMVQVLTTGYSPMWHPSVQAGAASA